LVNFKPSVDTQVLIFRFVIQQRCSVRWPYGPLFHLLAGARTISTEHLAWQAMDSATLHNKKLSMPLWPWEFTAIRSGTAAKPRSDSPHDVSHHVGTKPVDRLSHHSVGHRQGTNLTLQIQPEPRRATSGYTFPSSSICLFQDAPCAARSE
jgi:hypothetical protein